MGAEVIIHSVRTGSQDAGLVAMFQYAKTIDAVEGVANPEEFVLIGPSQSPQNAGADFWVAKDACLVDTWLTTPRAGYRRDYELLRDGLIARSGLP